MTAQQEVEALVEAHATALRDLQALDRESVERLRAQANSAVSLVRRANGDAFVLEPLYFELTPTAKRGVLLGQDEEGGVEYGFDSSGRIVCIGSEFVVLYGNRTIDRIQVRRNGRVGSISRYLVDDSDQVQAVVALSSDGKEFNARLFHWDGARVMAVDHWNGFFGYFHHYEVDYADDGSIRCIVLSPDHVVYERPKQSWNKLLKHFERTLFHHVDMAVGFSETKQQPLYAVLLTYSLGNRFGLLPPDLYLGVDTIRRDLATGTRSAEEMWNPLMDALPQSPIEHDESLLATCRELRGLVIGATEVEAIDKAYVRWSKRWTKELRTRKETSEDFVVLAFDPEYHSIHSALSRILPKREVLDMGVELST